MICSVEGCDRPQYVSSSDLCSKHYQRMRLHGSTAPTSNHGMPDSDRLMKYVQKDASGCWLFTGRIGTGGYGYFGQHRDGSWKPRRAHRVAYELFVGPISEGLQIDHLCRVRHCVNPAHLEAVTAEVNNARSTSPSAANRVATECKRGHALEGENVQIINSGGRQKRRCKECAREARRLRAIAGGA